MREWLYKQLRVGVTECSSLGFSGLELEFRGASNSKLKHPQLLHSVTTNSELLIELFFKQCYEEVCIQP